MSTCCNEKLQQASMVEPSGGCCSGSEKKRGGDCCSSKSNVHEEHGDKPHSHDGNRKHGCHGSKPHSHDGSHKHGCHGDKAHTPGESHKHECHGHKHHSDDGSHHHGCHGDKPRSQGDSHKRCHGDKNHLHNESHEHELCSSVNTVSHSTRFEWTSEGCDAKDDGNPDDEGALCVAVVGANGTDISLIDASGNVRGFSYKGDIRKLCFSSHGQDADDLLTPCFDEDGNHGIPDESCFCGVERPHLHAHVHDPKTCSDDGTKAAEDSDLMKLAKLTLFPTDDHEDVFVPAEDNLLQIEVSEHMPKACNAKELLRHISDSGTDRSDASRKNRRIHKVKHADHVDFLVHNSSTGDLHLEHSCNDCGGSDYHGTFKCVGKRRLNQTGSGVRLHFFEVSRRGFSLLNLFEPESGRVSAFRKEVSCCASGTCKKHVMEETPACCLSGTCKAGTKVSPDMDMRPSCCSEGGCTRKIESSKGTCCGTTDKKSKVSPCCSKKTKMDPPCGIGNLGSDDPTYPSLEMTIESETTWDKTQKTVQSSFHCSQICCASEIPLINSALDPIEGIKKVTINVPLKTVIVGHETGLSARDIETILNQNQFGASIKKDGGASIATQTKGRSSFFVGNICCSSEIPALNDIIKPMESVSKVSINVTTKMVYVDHDTVVVSARAICDSLNVEGFEARLEHDAATSASNLSSAFVTSKISLQDVGDGSQAIAAVRDVLEDFDLTELKSHFLDVQSKTISIEHNPFFLTASEILQSLSDGPGICGHILSDGAENMLWEHAEKTEEEVPEETTSTLRPTVIIAGLLWIISMLSFIGGDWDYLKYVALVSVIFGLPPIGVKACLRLQHFQFDTNCLMFFAALGAIALAEFTEAAAVTFLFALSEWLEVRASSRARQALSAIVQLRPECANLVHPSTKEVIVVSAASVPIGALVSVKTGDKIPCDGVVVEGRSTVDESSLTGESRPVRKGPNDEVSGGTINSGSVQLMIRTTSTADDSAVARLIRLVEEAQANRSETEKIVDQFARVYTPFIVFSALMMCTIPWAWGYEMGAQWTRNGLVLIVVACPCALIISTPVSYVAGLAATAQKGVLVKGGAHLEALGLVKKVCFDKTGTLTQGKFKLLHLKLIGGRRTRKDVLQILSLMEERASHPLAQAILDAARNEGVSIPKSSKLEDHTFLAGEGVSGIIDGAKVYVGNFRLFGRLGHLSDLPEVDRLNVEQWEAGGGTVGFMAIEGDGIVCAYCVADAVRPESAEVVGRLRSLGIEVSMLTGDNRDAANAIGKQVGLQEGEIKGQLLPEEKLSIVEGMKDKRSGGQSIFTNIISSKGMVLMCGDGINDGPSLAAADVGVAMGEGAALAMETADVTLLDSNLNKLVYSIQMGRRVIRKIEENVLFSLAVKFLVLGFALAGKAHLWAAIASDVGTMILVTLNGMLLLPSRRKGTLEVSAAEEDGCDGKSGVVADDV